MNKKITSFFNKKRNFKKYSLLVIVLVILIMLPEGRANAGLLTDIWDLASFPIDFLLGFVYMFIFVILNICLLLSTLWVMFGAWLVDVAMSPSLYVGSSLPGPVLPGVLTSQAVDIGWTTVRDMSNMFFMFFFLLAAFGTIVGSKSFNVKSLLPKIIISMFLINFSKEITLLVIDISQLFMYEIGSWMGGFSSGSSSLTNIVHSFNNEIDFLSKKGIFHIYRFHDIVQVSFALFYSLVLGAIYVMLAVFLIIRLVSFTVLLILSPFAFLSIALPSMSKHASRWWSELSKWAIFGPAFMFFIFISATMANELLLQANLYGPAAPPELGLLGITFYRLVMASIPLMILMVAPQVASELGVKGASQLVGGAGGVGKIIQGTRGVGRKTWGFGKSAGGAVTSRNKYLANKVDGAKIGFYNGMGKVPGMKGMALQGKAGVQKKRDERMKKMEMDWGDLKSIDLDLLEDKAKGVLGTTDDKAFLLKVAAAQGKLGDIAKNEDGSDKMKDGKKVMKYGDYLEGASASLSKKELGEVTDKNLRMKLQTPEAKERMAKMGNSNDSINRLSTDQKARLASNETTIEEEYLRESMSDIIKEGKAHEVQDLNQKMTAKAWHDSQTSEQRKSATSKMTDNDRKKLQAGYMANTDDSMTEDDRKQRKALEQTVANGNLTDRNEAQDKLNKINNDEKFRTEAVKAGKNLSEAFKGGADDMEEAIGKAVGKLDAKQLGKMKDSEREKYGHYANISQTRKMHQDGDVKEVEQIHDSKVARIKVLDSSNSADEAEIKMQTKHINNIRSMVDGTKLV